MKYNVLQIRCVCREEARSPYAGETLLVLLSGQDCRLRLGGDASQMSESGSVKGSVSKLIQIAPSAVKSFRLIHRLLQGLLFSVCSKLG